MKLGVLSWGAGWAARGSGCVHTSPHFHLQQTALSRPPGASVCASVAPDSNHCHSSFPRSGQAGQITVHSTTSLHSLKPLSKGHRVTYQPAS